MTPRPSLDVRDLQLVLTLAEAGSTVAAAARLHMAQSAVSRGLMLVEEKIGTRLFERTARGLRSTPSGLRLIGGAGAILTQIADLEAQAKAPTDGPASIRVVCECYTAYRWLPSALARLRRDLPGADISLAIEQTGAPAAGVCADDGGMELPQTEKVAPPIREIPLFSDEIVFVMSRHHPLATRSAIAPRDLARVPLIVSSQTPPPERRWFLAQVFGESVPPLEFLRFPLTEAMVDAARAGMGVAALSEWIAGPYLADEQLCARRLRGRPLRRPWRMAFRRNVEPLARRLAVALEQAAPRAPAAACQVTPAPRVARGNTRARPAPQGERRARPR